MNRKEKEYKEWRNLVLKRDNCTCQLCGATENENFLHVHHIVKYSENEELRINVNNGITLCNFCHQQVLGKEKRYEQIFKEILKNPIWEKKEMVEVDEDIEYKNYEKLNKYESVLCLTQTSIDYIEDVYAFKIYCYLCSKFDYDLNCSISSLAKISQDCNIARSTVQKAIKYLEDRGFIQKLKNSNLKEKSNCYKIRYIVKTKQEKEFETFEEMMGEGFYPEIEVFLDENGKVIKERKLR